MTYPVLTLQSIRMGRGWDGPRLREEVLRQWFSGEGPLTELEMGFCVSTMPSEYFLRRPILVTYDRHRVRMADVERLHEELTSRGFSAVMVSAMDCPCPVFAQSLDGLPIADIQSLDIKSKQKFAKECSIVNVLREREACAKIADQVADEDRTNPGYGAAVTVAERIRDQPQDFKTVGERMEIPE